MKTVGAGEALARFDYTRGYRLQPRDVVLIGLDEHGLTGPHVTYAADGVSDGELIDDIVDTGLATMAPEYRKVLVVRVDESVGDVGVFHARLHAAAQSNAHGTEMVAHLVRTSQDQLFIGRDLGEEGVMFEPAGSIPDVSAEMVAAGYDLPAASRDEYLERFDPHPEPGFEALSPDGRAGRYLREHARPSEQAEIARRCLDNCADADPRDARLREWKPVLGYLANQRLAVRDALLTHAAESAERTQALVGIYREAPDECRPVLAAAAGTAMYLRGAGRLGAERVLDGAAADPEQGRLAYLTRMMATHVDASPETLRRQMAEGVADALEDADRRWEAQRWTGPARQTDRDGADRAVQHVEALRPADPTTTASLAGPDWDR